VLEADKKELTADGKDLSYVTVKVVDKDGNLCPDASNELNFKVTGAGKFKVTANGDASSLELFQLPHMKTFQGMLVATIQSGIAPGKITLNVSSNGLKSGVVILDVK
jgi:beta-galactosidase